MRQEKNPSAFFDIRVVLKDHEEKKNPSAFFDIRVVLKDHEEKTSPSAFFDRMRGYAEFPTVPPGNPAGSFF
jgi:hypothetical protein